MSVETDETNDVYGPLVPQNDYSPSEIEDATAEAEWDQERERAHEKHNHTYPSERQLFIQREKEYVEKAETVKLKWVLGISVAVVLSLLSAWGVSMETRQGILQKEIVLTEQRVSAIEARQELVLQALQRIESKIDTHIANTK